MVSVEFSEAVAEVIDILNHTNKEDVDKISSKFMNYLKNNCSKTYKPSLDHTKRIKDMKLKEDTIGILIIIYNKFWCDEKQAKEFYKKLKNNEEKYQLELREKYNPDNLFKNGNKTTIKEIENETVDIVKYKEPIFKRIINKIKSILHIS